MSGARKKRYAKFRSEVRKHTAKSKKDMPGCPYGYTLNHIVPIARAFTLGLTPEETGSLVNLEWTPFQENLQQGQRLTRHSIHVLRELGRNDIADKYEGRIID